MHLSSDSYVTYYVKDYFDKKEKEDKTKETNK